MYVDDEIEPVPIMVKVIATYPNHQYRIKENQAYYFVDQAPYFERWNELYNDLKDIEDIEFEIWHFEVPNPTPEPTHVGSPNLH